MRKLYFLRTNIQDEYNYGMNSIDIADQLRNSYNFSRFSRNNKWWWALFLWGLGVLLTNAYILYHTSSLLIWKYEKNEILTQYEFRKLVALAWLDPIHMGHR